MIFEMFTEPTKQVRKRDIAAVLTILVFAAFIVVSTTLPVLPEGWDSWKSGLPFAQTTLHPAIVVQHGLRQNVAPPVIVAPTTASTPTLPVAKRHLSLEEYRAACFRAAFRRHEGDIIRNCLE